MRATELMGWKASPILHYLAPIVAGALFPLGLSPFDSWLMVPLSAALFTALLHSRGRRSGWLTGWLYGTGFFGAGASWVYVSIHVYGSASPALAILLTVLFCGGLALLFALQGQLYNRWFAASGWPAAALAFPALWVLFEWLRSWLLTGFPWLYAGYASLDTPLAGWAPIIGIYGNSLLLVALGSLVAAAYIAPRPRRRHLGALVGLVAVAGLAGEGLKTIDWTQPAGEALKVAIYQPNISLEDKWNRRFLIRQLDQYRQASAPAYPWADILLWPESALPAYQHQVTDYLDEADKLGLATNTTLITGIPIRTSSGAHNSIIAIGLGSGVHHKQKLVPFGEYVPLAYWLRGIIDFFDLPMSNFNPGTKQPPLLLAGQYRVAPFICYEIVYPDFVTEHSRDAHFLVTVSNDSWFGDSIGPLQHLQMARFRALETGRPLLRGTNNGVSAIIDHRGDLQGSSEQFVTTLLQGDITPRQGSTPIMRSGSWPILTLCGLVLLGFLRQTRH